MSIIDNTVRRARAAMLFFRLFALLIYAIYIIYNINNAGNHIKFKIALLILTGIYALILIALHFRRGGGARRARRRMGRLYRSGKILINGATLYLIIDGIIHATRAPTLWSILLAVGMLIGWVTSLITEMVFGSISRRVDLIEGTAEFGLKRLFRRNKE